MKLRIVDAAENEASIGKIDSDQFPEGERTGVSERSRESVGSSKVFDAVAERAVRAALTRSARVLFLGLGPSGTGNGMDV